MSVGAAGPSRSPMSSYRSVRHAYLPLISILMSPNFAHRVAKGILLGWLTRWFVCCLLCVRLTVGRVNTKERGLTIDFCTSVSAIRWFQCAISGSAFSWHATPCSCVRDVFHGTPRSCLSRAAAGVVRQRALESRGRNLFHRLPESSGCLLSAVAVAPDYERPIAIRHMATRQ